MKLICNNKEIEIIDCKTFFSRFMGNMFKKNIERGLLFRHCNSIHTFFMKENIDVLMCDRDFKIIYYYKDLEKNRVILPKRKVYAVIELPVNFYSFEIGERIVIKNEG